LGHFILPAAAADTSSTLHTEHFEAIPEPFRSCPTLPSPLLHYWFARS
jgi:hypothetical protein